MCTVTFLPGRKGYRLGMNRDEKLTRAKGLPPQPTTESENTFIAPTEPGGGTWIGLNDRGVCLALINWYSVSRRASGKTVSRGEIIPAARHAASDEAVGTVLATLSLNRTNPFRLIGVFPASRTIIEWRWDLKRLTRLKHSWRAQQWISSGFDEPTAQRIRGRTFATARRQKTFGNLEWLRRLHRSHPPTPGPFSTCMHREDAATVSYTEVLVSDRLGIVRYHAGPPCKHSAGSVHCLQLPRSPSATLAK
jgi:hypothetical protein